MKSYFFDCGTHHGEGLTKFIQMFSMDRNWDIYSFEPNAQSFFIASDKNYSASKVQFINAAVWTSDGTAEFHAETPQNSTSSDGAGSSLLSLQDWQPRTKDNPGAGTFEVAYSVRTIDFSEFLSRNTSPGSTVVVKLDIEGSEYAVLRKMIRDGSISRVTHLFVEFHDWALQSETAQSTEMLIQEILRANPALHFQKWQ